MSARTYPVPKAVRDEFRSDCTTLDEMEMVSLRATAGGMWAAKVLNRENEKLLNKLLGDQTTLPRGVVDPEAFAEGDEIVVALVSGAGETWFGQSWESGHPVEETVLLTEGDVAFIARAFLEGADSVLLSSSWPLAFITAAVTSSGDDGESALPASAIPVAIVDSLHNDAVLELLAVAPGPHVYRRHAGAWHEDPNWVAILASVNPPKMVKLDPDQVAAIAQQIDAATSGEFKPIQAKEGVEYRPVRAACTEAQRVQDDVLDRMVQFNIGLLAVAGRELSPKDYANTERLRRYWLYGRGAAKIRWFTPGSWRRCYRHLVKYLGPRMTPGYCTNLSERLGGHGVATHVGD